MTSRCHSTIFALLVLISLFTACRQLPPEPGDVAELDGFDAAVDGLERRSGLVDLYLDHAKGRVLAHLPPADEASVHLDCLYIEGLTRGLGSNPVGLDRGQLGPTRVVAFRRVGHRIVLEQPNLAFRARSRQAPERQATRDSFASSVLWAGEVEGADAAGGVLVDLTSLLVSDAHGSAATLSQAGEGSWTLDAKRSMVDLDATLSFQDNLEFDALLTFQCQRPGPEVRATVPSADSLSIVQHHSFVRLPDAGYVPRKLDARMGHFGVSFLDYAAPIDEANRTALATRLRLERVDPSRRSSPARNPIIYYVDRGAPEPIRSALVEGASWWSEAFAAAGFEDAFRVELLPENAHPLDVRYHVIQWVHRATRGWSYGGGVVDPRTGERIKGHVSLGSLRVRQDRLLFEGLLGVERTGSGKDLDPVELSLARLRQLAAHEVGHTLGLSHNFTASTQGRTSVMDYPAPLVRPATDGGIDVSGAYAVGIGTWDKHAIRWLYTQFAEGTDEDAALEAIVAEGRTAGLLYHSDEDARGLGAALPVASLWDNGSDPVTALLDTLEVRARALASFGTRNLRSGRPRAELEEVLVPLYFHHRYQLHAAAKTVGGLDYQHAHIGDPAPWPTPIAASEQARALEVCLKALAPETLDLPASVLELLGPRTPSDPASRERFRRSTGAAFDSLGAARTAADLVVELLLEPSRCARIHEFASRDDSLPSLDSVLTTLVDVALAQHDAARTAALAEEARQSVFDGLTKLASDARATAVVRDAATQALVRSLADERTSEGLERRISQFLERPLVPQPWIEPSRAAPPGSPIGHALAGCGCGE